MVAVGTLVRPKNKHPSIWLRGARKTSPAREKVLANQVETMDECMATIDGPWGRRIEAEGGASHILQTGVALDGNLVAAGAIQYPADDNGVFPLEDGNEVRISRDWSMRIRRCRSSRDRSGFLKTEEYGPELSVPGPLADIIERALRIGTKMPIMEHSRLQSGELANSLRTACTHRQPLSDWILRIDEEAGTIHVALSAALYGAEPIGLDSNCWAGMSNRVEISFSILPVTRIACFGSYIPSYDQGDFSEKPASVTIDRETLDICRAPVGTHEQYAVSSDRWFTFLNSSESRSISFTPHDAPNRYSVGFVTSSSRSDPSARIIGVDLDTVFSMFTFGGQRSIYLHLRDGSYGGFSGGGSDDWFDPITDAELNISLVSAGLQFSYNAKTDNYAKSGEFCLIWELLLLRYPKFARFLPTNDDQGAGSAD